jgi:hypothetical protein
MFGGQPELALDRNASECCRNCILKKRIGMPGRTSFGVAIHSCCSQPKKVRHEIVLNEDGEADENIDLQSKYLSRSAHSE